MNCQKCLNNASLLNIILITIIYLLNISSIESSKFKDKHPKIVTKNLNITAYEGRTVVLPCVVKHLQPHHYVIWQYGLRGKQNQTLLSIGTFQTETNYRMRILNSDGANDEHHTHTRTDDDDAHKIDQTEKIIKSNDHLKSQISAFNIELRKLQLNDTGYYECQLNTKPTLKNYIYLKVLGEPKIHQIPENINKENIRVELTCEVNNANNNINEINWIKDGKILNYHNGTSNIQEAQQTTKHIDQHPYKIQILSLNEKLISKLIIRKFRAEHKGIYKCRCDDGAEAVHVLNYEAKSNRKLSAFASSGTTFKFKLNSISLLPLTIIIQKFIYYYF